MWQWCQPNVNGNFFLSFLYEKITKDLEQM